MFNIEDVQFIRIIVIDDPGWSNKTDRGFGTNKYTSNIHQNISSYLVSDDSDNNMKLRGILVLTIFHLVIENSIKDETLSKS